MKIWLFDVDHTLEVSNGPVRLKDIVDLAVAGDITGINGNWAVAVNRINGWWHLFSLIGPMAMSKEIFMQQIKTYIKAEDYIMVGNDDKDPKWTHHVSMDKAAADAAGWRFINEDDFSQGVR